MICLPSVDAILRAFADNGFVGEVKMDDPVRASSGILILQPGLVMCSRPSSSCPQLKLSIILFRGNGSEEAQHVQT